jgi:glycosyltransferase involved in cell wall biosynthesis
LKILLVQESDWLRRGPHDQHHLVEKLSLRGHEIRVIDFEISWRTQNYRGFFPKKEVFSNVSKIYEGGQVTVIRPTIVKVKAPGVDYASLIFSHGREINRQIKEFAPDVIIGLGILNSYLAMKAAQKSNIPFIYWWVDVLYMLIPFKWFQPLGKFFCRKTLGQADVVLASNNRLGAHVVEMGAPVEQTRVLAKGVDFRRFNPDVVDSSVVREQYGIKPGDTVITFIGVLSSIRGAREVALELFKVDEPHLKFLIVGTGPPKAELLQMQERYSSLQERLIITGERPYDEIPGLLAASDICLLPYHKIELTKDLVPMKIFDYLAMGKPIISTRLPGMVEEFGEDNGIVYVDRPEDTVKKAIELVAGGSLSELGAKARKLVEGRSCEAMGQKKGTK